MELELQKKIFDKYPLLFVQRSLPMTQTCMCWGLECGPGWFKILDNLSALIYRIEGYDKWYAKAYHGYIVPIWNAILWKLDCWKPTPKFLCNAMQYGDKIHYTPKYNFHKFYLRQGVQASQVKEKYGTLRFYTSTSSDLVDNIISWAETESSITCEECGEWGKLRDRGWLATLCAKHAKERNYPISQEEEDELKTASGI